MPASTAVQSLAIDLERTKGTQTAHEKVCEERYQAINQTMAGMSKDIGGVDTKVGTLGGKIDELTEKIGEMATAHATALGVAKGLAEARKPKWWVAPAATLGAVILAAVIGAFGFMISRLISDNDLRIADAKQHPVATSTVTVNPAAQAPAAGVAQPNPSPPAGAPTDGTVQQAQ